jgi:hypothetical protein
MKLKIFLTIILFYILLSGCSANSDEESIQQTSSSNNAFISEKQLKIITNNATIPINSRVILKIENDTLKASSVNIENIYVELIGDINSKVSGTVELLEDLQTIIFIPDNYFEANSKYQLVFSNRIENTNSEKLENDIFIYFQTGSKIDTESPKIVYFNPEKASDSVQIDQVIIFDFDEYIQVENLTISLKKENNTLIEGTTSVIDNGSMIKFFPNAKLDLNTSYTITLSTSVKDLSNNKNTINENFNFKTVEYNNTILSAIKEEFSPQNIGKMSFTVESTENGNISYFKIDENLSVTDNSEQIRELFENNSTYFYLKDSNSIESINIETSNVRNYPISDDEVIIKLYEYYLLTENNIYSLNENFEKTQIATLSSTANDFLITSNTLFIATKNGIFKPNSQETLLEEKNYQKLKIFNNYIYALYIEDETYKLGKLNIQTDSFEHILNLDSSVTDFVVLNENSFYVLKEKNIEYVQLIEEQTYQNSILTTAQNINNLYLNNKNLYFTTEDKSLYKIDVSISVNFYVSNVKQFEKVFAIKVAKATQSESNYLFAVDYNNGIYATKLNETGSLESQILYFEKPQIKNFIINESKKELYLITDNEFEIIDLNINTSDNSYKLTSLFKSNLITNSDIEPSNRLIFDVAINENTLFVSTETGLKIFDIDNRTFITNNIEQVFYNLAVSNNKLFATTLTNEIFVFDLANSHTKSSFNTNSHYSSRAIFINDNYIFVGFNSGDIEVFDKNTLEFIQKLDTSNSVTDLLYFNNHLYVAENKTGVRIFDSNLTEIGAYSEGSIFALTYFLNKIYLSAKENGIFIANSF